MSEKLDGVRCYWGSEKLISRNGNVLPCPSWFSATLPNDITLDGELFMGTTFAHVTAVLTSKNGDWSQLEYHIFDIPSSTGTYEMRERNQGA